MYFLEVHCDFFHRTEIASLISVAINRAVTLPAQQ